MCYGQSGTLQKREKTLIESMCPVLRHASKMNSPALVCPRMPMETKSPPFFLTLWEETPMSLSLPRQNSAAGLFVRLFTSLLMSTRIKMRAQSRGSEAQSPPPHIIKSEQKKKNNPVHCSVCARPCVSACICVHLKWFLEWKRTILRSKFPLKLCVSNHGVPPL